MAENAPPDRPDVGEPPCAPEACDDRRIGIRPRRAASLLAAMPTRAVRPTPSTAAASERPSAFSENRNGNRDRRRRGRTRRGRHLRRRGEIVSAASRAASRAERSHSGSDARAISPGRMARASRVSPRARPRGGAGFDAATTRLPGRCRRESRPLPPARSRLASQPRRQRKEGNEQAGDTRRQRVPQEAAADASAGPGASAPHPIASARAKRTAAARPGRSPRFFSTMHRAAMSARSRGEGRRSIRRDRGPSRSTTCAAAPIPDRGSSPGGPPRASARRARRPHAASGTRPQGAGRRDRGRRGKIPRRSRPRRHTRVPDPPRPDPEEPAEIPPARGIFRIERIAEIDERGILAAPGRRGDC